MGQGDASQYPQYVQYPQGAPPVVPGVEQTLTPDQIDGLLAPIALYPDPLLSLIFPAATYPQDIIAAEEWLQSTPSPTEADIAAQGWDATIKGLVHYPSVLKMMNDQIDWTQVLGAAFATHQQDVLDSVQRLRARAQAAQNLQNTPQEQVLVDNGAIRIEPVDPEVIYVPQYDPNVVYVSTYPISFGIGFPIGLWCDNDFDWNRRYIVNGGGWFYGWHHPAEWDRRHPTWDRRPAGWVAAPRPWVRAASRPPPRLTSAAVSHLGLDRPHGAVTLNPAAGTARNGSVPLPIGRQPAPAPSRNVFGSNESRAEVQRAAQRISPPPTQPAAAVHPSAAVQTQTSPRPPAVAPTPRPAVETPTPRPPAVAPVPREPTVTHAPRPPAVAPAAAPRASAAPPQATRAVPSGVFQGDSAVDTRAQSERGKKSRQ